MVDGIPTHNTFSTSLIIYKPYRYGIFYTMNSETKRVCGEEDLIACEKANGVRPTLGGPYGRNQCMGGYGDYPGQLTQQFGDAMYGAARNKHTASSRRGVVNINK